MNLPEIKSHLKSQGVKFYHEEKAGIVLVEDNLTMLRRLPADCIDTIRTRPPYWGLRDYGDETNKIWDGEESCKHIFRTSEVEHDNLRYRGKNSTVGNNKNPEMHKGKNLERFLAKVFRKIPGVIDVNENGFGWGTDYGADLIVTMRAAFGNLDFENKIVVQVKSFYGEHYNLEAVEQVKTAIKKYDATAGMIITTAQRTEVLEDEIQVISDKLDCPIDLLAGEDVAKFVVKNASDLLFRLGTAS